MVSSLLPKLRLSTCSTAKALKIFMQAVWNLGRRTKTLRVFQDAARASKSLPGLAMTLRAVSRRYHHVFRFKSTASALQLKYGNWLLVDAMWIVCCELARRCKTFHTDRHDVSLLTINSYSALPRREGIKSNRCASSAAPT